MNALGLPKNTDEEKAKRTAAIQQAYKDAAMVPFEIGELAYQIFDLAALASKKGNQNLITDGIIAAINARALSLIHIFTTSSCCTNDVVNGK